MNYSPVTLMALPAPNPDPSWDYSEVWKELSKTLDLVVTLHNYLAQAETASEVTDRGTKIMTEQAIGHLRSIVSSLNLPSPQTQAEEEFQAKLPTFLKIGDRTINPSLVTAFLFEEMEPIEEGDPKESKMEVWFSDDSSLCFYEKEAEILKKFLLSGSRTYDLNNLFG